MVQSHIIVHLLQIAGLFICANKLWPKGVTYGEQEEWEKAHRARKHTRSHPHSHSHSHSRSKSDHSASHKHIKHGNHTSSPVHEDISSPEDSVRGQRFRRKATIDNVGVNGSDERSRRFVKGGRSEVDASEGYPVMERKTYEEPRPRMYEDRDGNWREWNGDLGPRRERRVYD